MAPAPPAQGSPVSEQRAWTHALAPCQPSPPELFLYNPSQSPMMEQWLARFARARSSQERFQDPAGLGPFGQTGMPASDHDRTGV